MQPEQVLDESERGGTKGGKSAGNSAGGFRLGRGLRGPTRREGRVFEWALEAVFSIPVGFGVGYLVDVEFGTGPIGLIVGGALGFVAFVRRLLQLRSTLGDEGESGGDSGERREPGSAASADRRDDSGRSGS